MAVHALHSRREQVNAPLSRPAAPAASLRTSPRIQAKAGCACGGSCPRCQAGSHLLQHKVALQRPGAVAASPRAYANGGDPLPDNLRAGLELLSGIDLFSVQVFRNSMRPALFNAEAYTEGNEIHLASGQERHLAHEGWHAVQQKQGRVRPTLHSYTTPINDEAVLEREADVMGARVLSTAVAPADVMPPAVADTAVGLPSHIIQRQLRGPQGDLMDVVMALSNRGTALSNWVFELGTAYERLHRAAGSLSSLGRRRIAAVDAAFADMAREDYSAASLVRWMRTIVASRNSLTARDPWTSERQHERRIDASRAVMRAAALHIPELRAAADQQLEASEERSQEHEERRLTRQLRRFIRNHWQEIRDAPSLQWVRIRRLMRRTLTSEERFDDYVASLADNDRRLHQFIGLMQRNPHLIQRHQNDFFRTLVLAVGGEWADIVQPGEGRALAAELTGDTEASMEAEVTGTVADTVITMLPGLDQIGDIRDFGAHLYALLNVDGRHGGEIRSPMRWVGVVLSAIGIIPTLGSFIKGTGRLVTRWLQRGVEGVAGIARRVAEPVIRQVRRHFPDVIPFIQRLLHKVSRGWGTVTAFVRSKWSDIAEGVTQRLDSLLVRATDWGNRIRRRWQRVRASAAEMIAPALQRLRTYLAPVYRGALDALRRGGEAVVDMIPPRLLRFGEAAIERSRDLLRTGQRHLSNLRDMVSSPTRRMQELDRSMDALEDVQRRLQQGLDSGEAVEVERLVGEVQRISADIERRLGRSAGAHGTPSAQLPSPAPATPTAAAPSPAGPEPGVIPAPPIERPGPGGAPPARSPGDPVPTERPPVRSPSSPPAPEAGQPAPTSGRPHPVDEPPSAGTVPEAEPASVSPRPPTARTGRAAAMRHSEMLEIFTRALRRPGPGGEVYSVYDSVESYDDAWRAISGDLSGDLPQGFVHNGVIHLPPNASSLTVLHESLHWASHQSGARVLLGDFVEEGLVESIARRVVGPEVGEVYEVNIRFVDELARVVGQDLLDNALLHGQWGPLRRALNAHFDSAQRTQELYALLRRIDGNGEPREAVERARRMLAGLSDDATLPEIRLPETRSETRLGPVSARPSELSGELPEGTHSIVDETSEMPGAPRIRALDPIDTLARLARTQDPNSAYVYRILNSDGEVIYYGISTDPVARLRSHSTTQGWAHEIHSIEVINQTFSRPQALALETDLIREAFALGSEIYNVIDDTIRQALGARGGSFAGEIEVPRPSAPWIRLQR